VLCSNFVKFGRREIGKVVRYLPTKKTKFRPALKLSLLRGSPQRAPDNVLQSVQRALDLIQIGSPSAELYPNV